MVFRWIRIDTDGIFIVDCGKILSPEAFVHRHRKWDEGIRTKNRLTLHYMNESWWKTQDHTGSRYGNVSIDWPNNGCPNFVIGTSKINLASYFARSPDVDFLELFLSVWWTVNDLTCYLIIWTDVGNKGCTNFLTKERNMASYCLQDNHICVQWKLSELCDRHRKI
jgi:hypothetical protein